MAAGSSPILGIPYLDPTTPAAGVYAAVNAVIDQLERFTVPTYANAGARDAALPAPRDGMSCRLLSPAVEQSYVAGKGWLQTAPTAISWGGKQTFQQAVYTGGAPKDLATMQWSASYPYLAIVTASVKVTGFLGPMNLWINQTGGTGNITAGSGQVVGDNVVARALAMVEVPAGGSLTVHATLSGPAGSSAQIYTDESHSFLQGFTLPIGTRL